MSRFSRTFLGTVLILSAVAGLSACGGGGGAPVAGGGTGGTGIGPATGFGSLTVNGIRYDDSGVTAGDFIDDRGRSKGDLLAGMVVRVTGTIVEGNRAGVASRIEVLRHVDGPMEDNAVDLAAGTVRVMGQTVRTDDLTVFDDGPGDAAFDNAFFDGYEPLQVLAWYNDNLARHPVLEVHGSLDNAGVVRASFVRFWTDDFSYADNVQVRGVVEGLDNVGKTFSVGRLDVGYGAVASVPAGLDNGAFVEVKGTISAADNVLDATSLEVEDPVSDDSPGDLAKVEATVTRIVSDFGTSGRFEILGPAGAQEVVWSTSATLFRDGSRDDIGVGVRLQVEGIRQSDGTLNASRISFRKPNVVRIRSTVVAKGTDNVVLTLFTTVTGAVLHPVRVDDLTQYKDDSAADLRTFGFGDLSVDDNVLVTAFIDNSTGTRALVASRVERIDDLDNRLIFQGPVDADTNTDPSVGTIKILGSFVQTIDPTTEFKDRDESVLSIGSFFSRLVPGQTVVKVRFRPINTTVADEVEIEPSD